MIAKMSQFIHLLSVCDSRNDAKKIFLDLLAEYAWLIGASKRKMNQIYSFETPETPYVEFGLTSGFEAKRAPWVQNRIDSSINDTMQFIAYQLQSTPEFDFVPSIGFGPGDSGLVARLFGSKTELLEDGALLVRKYAATTLEELSHLDQPDIEANAEVREMVDDVERISSFFDRCIEITYPALQGPITNLVRILPQEETLMSICTDPEVIKTMSTRIADVTISILRKMHRIAGGSECFRPRGRFWQPPEIKGLFVDDYVSVIRPSNYLEVCSEGWEHMAQQIGPLFLHTCGPTLQAAEAFKKLPGLRGFETAYVNKQHKTTLDIQEMKRLLGGKVVFCSFGLPFGNAVEDGENLTADWLRQTSCGGGFALQASGTPEDAALFAQKLGLA